MKSVDGMDDTVVVFTRKTVDEICKTGGSQYWRLKAANAGKMTYLVCTRNSKESQGREPHGSGFLIGRISGVVPTPENPGRFLIQMSEWAEIEELAIWQFGRNPVHYAKLADLGIDLKKVRFKPVPEGQEQPVMVRPSGPLTPITIAEAKQRLALTFGVGVDAIEITIRA